VITKDDKIAICAVMDERDACIEDAEQRARTIADEQVAMLRDRFEDACRAVKNAKLLVMELEMLSCSLANELEDAKKGLV
jgi:hypothetical protein